ncbi:hypothetical protein NVP1187O_094 [Vibrio phage 1.187.O._10N.286.49.F1]|nr:hypothetical protein NVP1187O_094 [Vibrio phage 1.187.O._10N.286.49.F1]
MKVSYKFKLEVLLLPIKHKIISWYDNFRMWELCFRMENCKYEIVIDSYESFAGEVGNTTANRIFEDMMEECYSDPHKHGESLDREGGNWMFRNHRYFCNDHLLLEMKVQDGNWGGTEIEYLEVTYES